MFVNWFIDSAQKFSQRPAVEVNDAQMTYQELGLLSSKIAQALQKQDIINRPIGLLAYRSFPPMPASWGPCTPKIFICRLTHSSP